MRWSNPVAAFLLVASMLATGRCALADESDFYRQKTMNFIVVYEAGGTYDLYSRLAAIHLSRFIPGNPKIVVQYMPGAGGATGAAHLFNKSPRDGTEIGMVDRGIATNQVLHPETALALDRFNWIGSLSSYSGIMYVGAKTGVKSVADLKQRPVIIGSWGVTTSSYTMPVLLNALAGTQFKVITGYRGAADIDLAYENGEVDGRISSWTTLKTEKADWIANKSVSIPFQTGIKRHPDLADVPLFTELASEPDARRILQFVDSDSAVGWSVVAPPDVPAERVATLRRAFDQMVVDPDFLADAKKRNLDVVSSSGVELAAVIKRTLAIPHQDIDRLSQLLSAQK